MEFRKPITVATPLGDSTLRFRRMTGKEELGRPFEYHVEMISAEEDLKFEDLLGNPMAVNLALPSGRTRFYHGLVSRFSHAGRADSEVLYKATLRPWLWFLSRTFNCRIFQEKTAVEIIKTIFRDHGFSDFDEVLSGSYRTMEYCVQYRESDFNFVSRLMENEGIYYYFKHEEQKHTLVLSDAYSSHDSVQGYEEIPYYPPSENAVRDHDYLWDWDLTQEVQSGEVTLNEFDFERPKAGLTVRSSVQRKHPMADSEVYDYPGAYLATADGERYARARIEELQAQFEEVVATGNARGLFAGGLFTLAEYPREDQNREYLVVAVEHDLQSQEYASANKATKGPVYKGTLRAIDAKEAFRPPRLTPKPFVRGPQTAVVVGKGGEEIWTDKYGRVKVQFHWDREGKVDENSSCWVRVSQPWAGKGWGAVSIPRIGQEVVVDFLEGDPDHPIITGRVYNADNMPPYALPAQAVVSGVKSDSTKGGGGYNEYVLDDTKGSELIREHGQKDKDSTIKHDLREHVHNNRSRDVGVDETISVGNDQTFTIGKNQTGTIGTDQTITVGSNKTETVGINTAETIGAAKELTIGAAYQVTVGAAMNESIGAAKAEEIGAAKSVNVGKSSSENIGADKSVDAGGNISESAGKDITVTSGKKMTLEAGDDYTVQGKKKGLINIADELTIKCGDASITLKKDGTISIKGKDVSVNGSGKINIKASGDVVIKGSKVAKN